MVVADNTAESMTVRTPPPFNHIVRRFADHLDRPDYRRQRIRTNYLLTAMRQRQLIVREDPARSWEHAHVSIRVKSALAQGARIIDHGGGGSILCYDLALSGFDVTVLDTDLEVEHAVNMNAQALGIADRLKAYHYDGVSDWPFIEESADAVLSISVFEAMLSCQRDSFFVETNRVLKPRGELLLTCDFGPGGRLVADPPADPAQLESDIIAASGMELPEELPEAPAFSPRFPPPVRLQVLDVPGMDYLTAAYTFAALRLVKKPGHVYPSNRQTGNLKASIDHGLDVEDFAAKLIECTPFAQDAQRLGPIVVRFELVSESMLNVFHWIIHKTEVRQCTDDFFEPTFVLSGTSSGIRTLLEKPVSFWTLYYQGAFTARGNISMALRLINLIAKHKKHVDESLQGAARRHVNGSN